MNRNRAVTAVISAWFIALCVVFPHTSSAASVSDQLTLRGFFTLDATYSDSAGASTPTRDGPLVRDSGEVSTDSSVIGVQALYAVTDSLDLTLQAVSTRQTDDSYSPDLEWAYLSYHFDNDFRLRGGRMKLSLLQGIELRYVGFSRLWARPLVPTSGAGGFDDYNGIEFIKGIDRGDYTLQFQGAYGEAEHHFDAVDNRDIKLGSFKIDKDGSWLNLALLDARYDVSTRTGIALKDNAQLLMGSLETELHFGDTVINGGYAYGDAEINPDEQLAYLSIGYRIDNFTPYVLLSQRKMMFDASETRQLLPPPPPPGALPPPPPLLDGTNATDINALGLRYDLTPTYDIKVQWDHWSNNNDSNPVSGEVKSDGNLFTIQLEGVF